MKNQKYRVAIVGGAGTWGRHYLRAYAEHPDCQIVALVDQAHDRRQAFADRYGVEVIFDTVTDLLANDLPDIVSIRYHIYIYISYINNHKSYVRRICICIMYRIS